MEQFLGGLCPIAETNSRHMEVLKVCLLVQISLAKCYGSFLLLLLWVYRGNLIYTVVVSKRELHDLGCIASAVS